MSKIVITDAQIESIHTAVTVSGSDVPDLEIRDGSRLSGLYGLVVTEAADAPTPFGVPDEILTKFLIRNDIRKHQGLENMEAAADESGLIAWLKDHGIELSAFLLQLGLAVAPK